MTNIDLLLTISLVIKHEVDEKKRNDRPRI